MIIKIVVLLFTFEILFIFYIPRYTILLKVCGELSDAERKYVTYDPELLTIYATIRHFHHHREGRELMVYTDHNPLTHAMNKTFLRC